MDLSRKRSSGAMITVDDALSDGHLLHDSQHMPRSPPTGAPEQFALGSKYASHRAERGVLRGEGLPCTLGVDGL